MNWIPRDSYEASDGEYRVRFRREYPAHLVRIEAEGYRVAISRDIMSDEGEVRFDFELQPAKDISASIVTAAGEPAANAKIALGVAGSQINIKQGDIDDVPNIFTNHDVTTGEDGRFVFQRVFPGKGSIGRRIILMVDAGATEVTSSQRVSAEFIAGKTTQLNLGGTGRPVIGKLAPQPGYAETAPWNFALVTVITDPKLPPTPTAPADVQDDPEKRKAWWTAWQATDEGKAWKSAYDVYQQHRSEYPYITATIDRDGSFRIDDVQSEDYVLNLRFDLGGRASRKNAPGVVSDYRFSVPPIDGGIATEPLDLGTLTLTKQ